MAKKINYKEKNSVELNKLLDEKREELRKLRFTAAGARAKDSNEPANIRKDIARIMTELGAQAKAAKMTA